MTPDSPSGLLLVDKPRGPTSHDIVVGVRKLAVFSDVKVGHAGTLDPFATGLLPVLVGQATRFQDALASRPKEYYAQAKFGAESSTGDSEGELSETGKRTSLKQVEERLVTLVGQIEQRLPMTSAVRVDGRRLYEMAHRGESIETPVRSVTVHEATVTDFNEHQQRAQLKVRCSKGTYIRQLVGDLGGAVGTGAYCAELRRTAVEPFRVESAIGFDRLRQLTDPTGCDAWLPLKISFGSFTVT